MFDRPQNKLETDFTIGLPSWVEELWSELPSSFSDDRSRMAAVLAFARRNVLEKTGGPFAAMVFEKENGKPVSVGVNRVVPQTCSSAHAEIVALALAQKKLGTFNLGGAGSPDHQLVVNWRPCAMCFGAIPWSGIRHLAVAGADSALEAITGFDEGPVPEHWINELELRGISVQVGMLRDQAVEIFYLYRNSGQPVYNGQLR